MNCKRRQKNSNLITLAALSELRDLSCQEGADLAECLIVSFITRSRWLHYFFATPSTVLTSDLLLNRQKGISWNKIDFIQYDDDHIMGT